MERTFCLIDKNRGRYGRYDAPDAAWWDAERMDVRFPYWAPHTVVELVPVPRPVPPRPTADIGADVGCCFRGGRLWDQKGVLVKLGWGNEIADAADLWQRHQEWLAAGGKDDE